MGVVQGAPYISVLSGRQPATFYIYMLTAAPLMTSSHSGAWSFYVKVIGSKGATRYSYVSLRNHDVTTQPLPAFFFVVVVVIVVVVIGVVVFFFFFFFSFSSAFVSPLLFVFCFRFQFFFFFFFLHLSVCPPPKASLQSACLRDLACNGVR